MDFFVPLRCISRDFHETKQEIGRKYRQAVRALWL